MPEAQEAFVSLNGTPLDEVFNSAAIAPRTSPVSFWRSNTDNGIGLGENWRLHQAILNRSRRVAPVKPLSKQSANWGGQRVAPTNSP